MAASTLKEFYWEGDEFIDFHHLLSGEPARFTAWRRWSLAGCNSSAGGSAPTPLWPAWYHHLLEVQLRIRRRKSCYCGPGGPEGALSAFLRSFPRWMPGFPDHQIAAYLGITPSAEPHPQAAENARSGLSQKDCR